jgi:hypothetical protein
MLKAIAALGKHAEATTPPPTQRPRRPSPD